MEQKNSSAVKRVLQGKVTDKTSQAFIYSLQTGLKRKISLHGNLNLIFKSYI